MLSIVYVQLQCHGYGLQITVNGPLRALLTSDPRQGHEETGGLIASDCFIQLIPFHSAYLFLLFIFFAPQVFNRDMVQLDSWKVSWIGVIGGLDLIGSQ